MHLRSLRTFVLALAAICLLSTWACRDDRLITDPSAGLSFSTDTLTFDTVFSTVGSATRNFRIFNPHKRTIRISSIRLAKLTGDQFRINVDGISASEFSDIDIPGEDSIWVFVEATIDPLDQDNPFVVVDRIEFQTNGIFQTIALQAWGQDANFFFGETLEADATWTDQRPYVIVGNREFPGIHVDTSICLTILAGTRVFFHRNAGLFVSGTLKVMGTAQDSVVFEGDRLEPFFDDLPAQWIGVFLMRGSSNSEINYTVINEADYGISAGSAFSTDINGFLNNASRPDVTLRQSTLKNIQVNAVFGFNADITMENCLAFNSNDNLVLLGLGGAYRFYGCTFENSGSVVIDHRASNLLIGNAIEIQNQIFANDLDEATFHNCIVHGSLEEEIALSNVNGALFNFAFDFCLLKTRADTTMEFTNNLSNQNPEFIDRSNENFRLLTTSPAIDAGGTPPVALNIDRDGRSRPQGGGYDIGAFERP